ncbi:MAG: hypothetical protein AAFX52_12795 [Pseudomonadota bacterium]
MKKIIILTILTVVFGIAGFALGEITQNTVRIREAGTTEEAEKVIFEAGQFTVPLFEGGNVPYFLLAEVNVEVTTYEDVSLLTNNRPAVRAMMLETFFELERRGEIKPETLNPETITAALRNDLEATFDLDRVSAVLLDRLLIQETRSKRAG